MRFTVIHRMDEHSITARNQIIEQLCQHNFIHDVEVPELVIVVGGDGTVLEACQRYVHLIPKLQFVAVHSGNLGFYADWMLTELDDFIAAVIKGEFVKAYFPLLETVIQLEDREERLFALNEVTVSDSHRTLAANVYIDGMFLETFRGTGFCVSTPSGSTAYNKSLGGAIIHPKVKSFQLTEMASINNRVYRTVGSPLILGEQSQVVLEFLGKSQSIVLTNDRIVKTNELMQKITFGVATHHICFARYRSHHFWERVKKSFI